MLDRDRSGYFNRNKLTLTFSDTYMNCSIELNEEEEQDLINFLNDR